MSSNNKEKEKTRGKDEEKEGKKKKKSSSSSSRSRSSKKEDAPDASAPSAHSDRFVLEDSVLLGPQAISLRKYRSVQTGMIVRRIFAALFTKTVHLPSLLPSPSFPWSYDLIIYKLHRSMYRIM